MPQEGVTVLPAGPREFPTDAYTNTAVKIGHGILSIYRTEEEALRESCTVEDSDLRIKDNFMTITVEAGSPGEAYQVAVNRLEAFLAHLAIAIRRVFSYQAVYFVDASGATYPPPIVKNLITVTTYNLKALGERVRTAAGFASVSDARLERALHYFEHALFLYEGRGQIAQTGSRHYRSLIAAVFLNLWKAVSTVVGEPGPDRDHQSRCRQFRIDQPFFDTNVRRLRDLRNDFDIAHYTLSAATLPEIEGLYSEAISTASEVIQRYREYLTSEKQDGSSQSG